MTCTGIWWCLWKKKKKQKICTANKWNTHWSVGVCFFLCSCFRSLQKKKKKSVLFLSQQSYKLLKGLILDTSHQLQHWTAVELHHAIRFIQWFWSRVGFRVGVRIGLCLQVRMEVRVVFGVQGWNWSQVWIWVGVGAGMPKLRPANWF